MSPRKTAAAPAPASTPLANAPEALRPHLALMAETAQPGTDTPAAGLGLLLLWLADEPSMGLAPQIVEEVFNIVRDLNSKEKVTFLLAEQNTNMALRYADYGYILENGRIVMDGAAKDLAENEDVKEFYLGVGGGDRKSFKDVKSYKRRKR